MNQRFKKIFSVLIAILVGAGIIFIAWQSGFVTSYETSSVPGSDDSSWKDALSVVPMAPQTKTLGVSPNVSGRVATTTVDIITRELLANYALVAKDKATTTLDNVDIQTITQILVDKTPAGTKLKQYTKDDLSIVETSTSTIELYKKELAQAGENFSKGYKADELLIVSRALDNKDTLELAPLALTVSNYQKFIGVLLSIKTPRSAVALHLYVIQGYATILSGIQDMQQIIIDPTRGMNGIAKYHTGVGMLAQIGSFMK